MDTVVSGRVSIIHVRMLGVLYASVQVKQAAAFILDQSDFEILRDSFADRWNPIATRLHFALASREDQIIHSIVAKLSVDVPTCNVSAFMFDGVILMIKRGTLESVKSSLAGVEDTFKISLQSVGSKTGIGKLEFQNMCSRTRNPKFPNR